MATINANGSKGHHKFTLTVTENSTSVENNTSSVSYSFVLSPIQNGWDWVLSASTISYSININGSVYSGTIPSYNGTSTVTLKTGTLTVPHNADGTKSIGISFSVTDSAGKTFTPGNASASGAMSLTTIPRASTFTLGGATSTNASINVNISRKSDSFTHRVRWKVGSGDWIGTVSGIGISSSFTVQPANMANLKVATITVGVQTYSGTTAIGSEATATRTITIPNSTVSISGTASTGSTQTANPSNSGGSLTYSYAWTLAGTSRGSSQTYTPEHSHLPNSTSGTLTVTLTTKNGTATINTTSASRTITVPADVLPSIGGITATEYVSNVSTKIGAFVQGYSRLTLGITGEAGSGGSTIKSYKITGAGNTINAKSGTTGIINQNGSITFTATVTDSRNRTASKTLTVNVIAYTPPKINSYSVERTSDAGTPVWNGTHAKTSWNVGVANLNSKNTISIKLQRMASNVSAWSDYQTYDRGVKTSDSGNVTNSDFSATLSYAVRVVVTDILGGQSIRILAIPTATVALDIGDNNVGVGKLWQQGTIDSIGQIYQNDGERVLSSDMKIPANTNLNNITQSGMYYCPANADALTITNKPIDNTAFSLLVERHAGIKQTFTTYVTTGSRTWYRNFYSSWGSWRELAGTDHTHAAGDITSGTFGADRIPNLAAGKITSGTFGADRIPSLPASKITSGAFGVDRIPSLPASKITSGTIADAILPAKAKPADYIVSSGNGWIQWNSGNMIVWGVTAHKTANTTAIGGGYRSTATCTFPKVFVGTPQVFAIAQNYCIASVAGAGIYTDRFLCAVMSFDSGRVTEYVRWQAIGKWK